MKQKCEREIVELHQFLEDWFLGRLGSPQVWSLRRFVV